MTQEKTPLHKWIMLAAAVLLVALTKLLLPPAGLGEAGFQILGILAAAIILFLSWGTGWTSMAIVFAMLALPGVSASYVTQATFGNSTVVFLLFCFMLAACLTESGAARRIAIWFLTNRLARKSPWWTIAMYFAAVYVLDFFLSASTCIMILMPILLSMFESVGLVKGERCRLSSMLLLCTVVVAQLANGANPISHAVTIQGFSLYESYVGSEMDFFTFCAVSAPISLITTILVFLLVRFIWKPDVSPFAGIDYDELASSCGPFTRRETASIIIYGVCVIFWLLPGLSGYVWPEAAGFLGRINNCLPPLAALFIMNFVKADGKPLLAWADAVKAVNWPTFMFIASIMGLGSFLGNADFGVSEWLSESLSPVFAAISPVTFVLVMVLIVNILTNFCSNSVALSVVYAVAMPLCLGVYSGSVSPALLSILVTSSAQNGWATAPASPTAAVAYASGWGSAREILVWGLVIMVLQVVVCMLFGMTIFSLLA